MSWAGLLTQDKAAAHLSSETGLIWHGCNIISVTLGLIVIHCALSVGGHIGGKLPHSVRCSRLQHRTNGSQEVSRGHVLLSGHRQSSGGALQRGGGILCCRCGELATCIDSSSL